MTAQSLGNHSKLISGSLWTRSPNNQLRENEKLEKAEAKYRSTAGRKDLGRKLRHAEIASQLEGALLRMTIFKGPSWKNGENSLVVTALNK